MEHSNRACLGDDGSQYLSHRTTAFVSDSKISGHDYNGNVRLEYRKTKEEPYSMIGNVRHHGF
jgi:hypothetical protein